MRWTHYPTAEDKRKREHGTEMTGGVWSDAPGPGNQHVLPDGWPARSASIMIVQTLAGRSTSSGPLPPGRLES